MAEAKWRRHFWSTYYAHNMLNGNRRRASYLFTCFLQFLQRPIDTWQFLQHLLYQSTRTLLGWHEHIITQTCCTFADLIPARGASRPGRSLWLLFSILHFLCEFWINLVFLQIISQFVHASRARPYRFLPSHIHCWYFLRYIILSFSHHMGIPCNAALCDIMIGLTIVSLQNISFLIRSFLILRLIHLKILISMVFILWRSALCNA